MKRESTISTIRAIIGDFFVSNINKFMLAIFVVILSFMKRKPKQKSSFASLNDDEYSVLSKYVSWREIYNLSLVSWDVRKAVIPAIINLLKEVPQFQPNATFCITNDWRVTFLKDYWSSDLDHLRTKLKSIIKPIRERDDIGCVEQVVFQGSALLVLTDQGKLFSCFWDVNPGWKDYAHLIGGRNSNVYSLVEIMKNVQKVCYSNAYLQTFVLTDEGLCVLGLKKAHEHYYCNTLEFRTEQRKGSGLSSESYYFLLCGVDDFILDESFFFIRYEFAWYISNHELKWIPVCDSPCNQPLPIFCFPYTRTDMVLMGWEQQQDGVFSVYVKPSTCLDQQYEESDKWSLFKEQLTIEKVSWNGMKGADFKMVFMASWMDQSEGVRVTEIYCCKLSVPLLSDQNEKLSMEIEKCDGIIDIKRIKQLQAGERGIYLLLQDGKVVLYSYASKKIEKTKCTGIKKLSLRCAYNFDDELKRVWHMKEGCRVLATGGKDNACYGLEYYGEGVSGGKVDLLFSPLLGVQSKIDERDKENEASFARFFTEKPQSALKCALENELSQK